MSKNGFIRAQQFVFQHTGADEEKLRNEFRILGYNGSMKFESGRAAVLSIHGTVDYTVKTSVFDPAVYEEAVELPCKTFGECTTFEDGELNFVVVVWDVETSLCSVKCIDKTCVWFGLEFG